MLGTVPLICGWSALTQGVKSATVALVLKGPSWIKTWVGLNCNHKHPYRKGGRGRFDAEEGNMIREARYCPTDFEDGRRGHEPGNVRNEALEARKGKETVTTLEFPEGGWPW